MLTTFSTRTWDLRVGVRMTGKRRLWKKQALSIPSHSLLVVSGADSETGVKTRIQEREVH